MNSKRIGRRTVALQTPPSVLSFANIGGRMEGQGPLAKYFDELCDDSFFGEKRGKRRRPPCSVGFYGERWSRRG